MSHMKFTAAQGWWVQYTKLPKVNGVK